MEEITEKNSLFKNLKKTWKYLGKGKKYLIIYIIISILEGVMSAIYPLISAKIILNLTSGFIEQLIWTALLLFTIDMGFSIGNTLKSYFYNLVSRNVGINLQTAIARETLRLEISEIDKASSGVFIDRLNKDTADIAGTFMEYSYWFSQIVTNIGVLYAIFALNKYLFTYSVVIALIVFIIDKKRLAKQYEIQKKGRKLHEKKTSLTSELVRGIRDIKVLNASKNILNQTEKRIVETSDEEMKFVKVRTKYNFWTNTIRDANGLFFIVLGSYLYTKSLLTLPNFLIVHNYQWKIENLLEGVARIMEFNKKFTLVSTRIFEIIEDDKYQKEKFGTERVKKLSGHIEFKDVEFGYDKEKKIIDKMNFEIEPNQKIAFVGKSGAGKTTIFSLITKLYNRNAGEILLDGHRIEDLDESSLRDNMSIITQNPYIFNFSIRDNLLLAKADATDKELRKACKMARIDDYIMSLENGYDTMVGENGVILSGGQKQRLAIARALLMKTEIILFDEATSALDNETQQEIQQAIDNLKGEYTILIVAHRLSTIIDSDKIFVVDDGKIIAEGTHKSLLKKNPTYRSLYEKDLQV